MGRELWDHAYGDTPLSRNHERVVAMDLCSTSSAPPAPDDPNPSSRGRFSLTARRRARMTDPFQSTDVPDVIEEYLEHGVAQCLAFNRRGGLLAGE